MTPNQKALRAAIDRLTEIEIRASEIVSGEMTDELDTELKSLAGEKRTLLERRASIEALLDADDAKSVTNGTGPDAEHRERNELRAKSRVGDFLAARLKGEALDGASAEFRASLGLSEGIPLDIWQAPARRVEHRADVVSASPGSNEGVNVQPIFPAIFARAILPRLGVTMPQVGSGAYATMTIDSSLTAGSKAKGAAQESTAATLSTRSTTPHRVAARLSIAVEDVATIGAANFESTLRQNLQLALSDQLDSLGLTGDPTTTATDPQGLFTQLTDPTDPGSVVDFDGFAALGADGIDGGPWAESMRDVRLLVNADTMKLAEKTFQSTSGSKGELSAAAYLRDQTAGFMASSRMPATASNIAAAIRHRAGTMGLDGVDAMQTATCPVWATLSIDDIYSDAASGIRHFTISALIGDVLINHASAYERVDLKLA